MEQVSAIEIAEALRVHVRSVQLRAKRENWPFLTDMVRGGAVRVFPLRHLPEEIRIQVARHRVASGRMIVAPAVAAAVEKARAGRQDQAEQAEVERIRRERQHAAFAQLQAEKQAVAYARRDVLRACEAYLTAAAAARKKDGIAEFCRLYNDGSLRLAETITSHIASVSVSSILRWQRDYRASGLPGLANGYCNPKQGCTSLTKEQQDMAIAILVRHPGCKINTIEQGLQTRFNGQTPNYSAIRRFILRWQEENASQLLFLRNPDAWRNQHLLAMGDAAEQIERLNQLWEFDSTPADVLLTDGRHCVIGCIDVFSRRFKLLVSKTSKSTAVAALTRRAVLDWGIPEAVKTDNGSDYVSAHLVGVFEALGIEQYLCPPFTPQAKPHIERAFRTFSHGIVELLPGYIGHSVADRKEIEARRSFAERLMRRGEPGAGADAVEVRMTAEEFQVICDRWVEAMYHQNKHGGLNDRTPAELARAWQGTERRIRDERALDILLAEAPRKTCTVGKKGIQINYRYYFSESFAGLDLVGREVRVKLDPTDWGTIYVFAESGKFLCTAIDPLRLGHDRAEIASKAKAIQNQIVREGARELKKLAKVQAVDRIHMDILEHREAQKANIVELPKKSEEYTTPALEEAAKAVAAIDAERRGQREMDEIAAECAVMAPESAPVMGVPAARKEKVVYIVTDSDRYEQIKGTARERGYITADNAEWLGAYYQTRSGRMYMQLEGDLRQRYQVQGAGQAEA
jgi:transposase InsO family protein